MNAPKPLRFLDRTRLRHEGRDYLYFGGCDYLGMAGHPALAAALQAGVREFGFNMAASRMTTGNHPLYERLEQAAADFFQAEAAVLLSCGYFSNLAAGQGLAGQFSHLFLDERAHVSLMDASQFMGCPILRFKHRSPRSLREALARCGKPSRPIVFTDGLFAHDGSIAPVAEYLALLPKEGVVLIDDAHGAGILGATGRGTPETARTPRERIIQTITFSKAFGAYGGAVVAGRNICDLIRNQSRAFAGNTPLPLPVASAAMEALEILKADTGRLRRLEKNSAYVKKAVRALVRFGPSTPGPIVGYAPRGRLEAKRFSTVLRKFGIWPPHLRYPGGPKDGCFRFAISSEHTPAQLDTLVDALKAGDETSP